MQLSKFLRSHTEQILQCWDEFAATVAHNGKALDNKALRDHAAEILLTIATDIETPQDEAQRLAKSKGKDDSSGDNPDTAAETHADSRMADGFTLSGLITEYRALRASVLRLWAKQGDSDAGNVEQLMRFNEGIDQAIAESVERFSENTKKTNDLFIGILGHDIRNPLNTIRLSATYLVRSGQLSKKAATPIENCVERINGLIEQLVDFTRAQSNGVMPIDRKPGNLEAQLRKIMEETKVRHPECDLVFKSVGHFEGSWDEGRMGQLLSNLLGNAVSYGLVETPVTVTMWETGELVRFSVHNHGAPIPENDLERIFHPLARGSETGDNRRHSQGLGLGLFICWEIVHAHDGKLTVTSTEKDGTAFVVSLPRVAPA